MCLNKCASNVGITDGSFNIKQIFCIAPAFLEDWPKPKPFVTFFSFPRCQGKKVLQFSMFQGPPYIILFLTDFFDQKNVKSDVSECLFCKGHQESTDWQRLGNHF